MRLLSSKTLNHPIQNNFNFTFYIPTNNLYLLQITALAHSWWQNLKSFKSFFSDDDLTLTIDSNIKFPKLNNKSGLFDSEFAWNGNNLKGLSKTNIILINLAKGNHTLNFIANQNPILESINIFQIENNNQITYIPQTNNPAQNGDRRQWLNLTLTDLPLNTLTIRARADKQGPPSPPFGLRRPKDDTDIKLIIDGNIQTNATPKSHKDWYWCGRVLNGQEKEFNKTLNLAKGLHYIELWADGEVGVGEIKLEINEGMINSNGYNKKIENLKKYNFKGIDGVENYNRYDAIIGKVVDFWNKEFINDTDPPEELLDPNLVKAMIFQESRIGYDPAGKVNVMQVGNPGDPSLETLRGEKKECWIHKGELKLLKYDANVNSVEESINWGVRWLYHKAQYSTTDNKRYWYSWQEAVKRYGPGTEEYVNSVWSIYTKGEKKEGRTIFKLWTIILMLIFPFLFFNTGKMYTLEMKVFDSLERERQIFIEDVKNDIKIEFNKDVRRLFFTIIEREKDWWEEIKVGRLVNGNIIWLQIAEPPSEQSILSTKFINLAGFTNPILEVYGKTHMGYGSLYLYEIKNKELKLLLETPAVDSYNDNIWSPDNYKKYGFSICGEVFTSGQLFSGYQDLNNDKIDDVVLTGQKEILCEKVNKNKDSKDDFSFSEVKVASTSVKKIFLWDNKTNGYKAK